MSRLLALFVAILFLQIQVYGQKYTFISYSTEQGLPQSQVSSIVQDSMGYLWVGTLGGLARFNGQDFVTFSVQNGLLNNRITHLEIIDDQLWVGHDGGVSLFTNGKFKKYFFEGQDKSRNVSDIFKFRNEIFVCSNGGGLFKVRGDELVAIKLPEADHMRIREAIVDNGILMLATRDGILISNDGQKFRIDSRFERMSYSGISLSNNVIHLTTYTNGYFFYDKNKKQVDSIPALKFGRSLYGSYTDRNDRVWFITQQGVVMVSGNREPVVIDSDNGLPVEMISCFYQDRDGTIWIGSQGKGFFRFAGDLFVYYDNDVGWKSDLFMCGFEKRNGDLFLGSYDKGVIKRDKKGNVEIFGAEETTIWSAISDVDGQDWFGAQTGLFSLNKKNEFKRWSYEDGLPGNKIAALYRLDRNKMLIGGNEGVALYQDGVFQRFNEDDPDQLGTVRDFCVIKDTIYCVSNLGIFVLKGDQFLPLLQDRFVLYNIESDQFNAIWYGTEEGLYRMSKNGIEKIKLLDDPGSNFINFLNFREGKMYVGTNNGLFVLTDLSSSEPKPTRYGISEGIIDLETNLNSSFFDVRGNFWFGTAKGLIRFDTRRDKRISAAPNIRLSKVRVNFSDSDYRNFAANFDQYELPTNLELPFNKNNLIFEFDAVSLGSRKGLRFQYLMLGLSEDWSPLTSVSTITFTSLPAGDYILKVRAVDLDGSYSNTYTIPITVNQAFYKTWWFITLIILASILIVYRIFRMRIRRIRDSNERERLQYKTRLLDLEQKSVNASMNRHFIFNALNSIQYFINTQDRISANKYLTNFAQLIRKNLDSANTDQNLITLEEELDRIKLYLSLEEMRFKDRFVSEINIGKGVDPESVMIPAMILQPFVENAIIHGILPSDRTDGKIKIDVYRENDFVFIRVEDNGIGIKKSLESKTEVVGDHRSQGMEISAKRVEILRSLTKEDISLEGPNEVKSHDGSINGTYVLLKFPSPDLDD